MAKTTTANKEKPVTDQAAAAPAAEAAAVANLATVNSTGKSWWNTNSEVPPGSRLTVELFEDGHIRFTAKGLTVTLKGEPSGKIEF